MSSISDDSLFSETYLESSSENSTEDSPPIRIIRDFIRIGELIGPILDEIESGVNSNDQISDVNNNSEVQEFSATNDVDQECSRTSSNEYITPPSWDEIYQKHSIMLRNREDAHAQSKFPVESWIHLTHDANIWAPEKPAEQRPSEINEALTVLRKHFEDNPWFYNTTDRCISLPTYGKMQHSLIQEYYGQPQLWSSDNEDDESNDAFEARRTNEVRHRSMTKKLMRQIQLIAKTKWRSDYNSGRV